MSEATSTAAAGIAIGTGGSNASAGAGLIQVVTVFFVAMGLQPEVLFAGMWGALASIIFFGSVPLEENSWRGRAWQTLQRFMVIVVSAVMAGYAAPLIGGVVSAFFSALFPHASLNPSYSIGLTAFVVGASGQATLRLLIKRYHNGIEKAPLTATKTTP